VDDLERQLAWRVVAELVVAAEIDTVRTP